MNIEINCADCGYNYYTAEHKKSKEVVSIMVGKCTATECELSIIDSTGIQDFTYPDLTELRDFVTVQYTLLSKDDCGCSN